MVLPICYGSAHSFWGQVFANGVAIQSMEAFVAMEEAETGTRLLVSDSVWLVWHSSMKDFVRA